MTELKPVFTVSELNEYVDLMLTHDPYLGELTVTGEISAFKRHTSGHLYFTLKDEGARVQCVMFRQNALYLNFIPQDGMKVIVGGTASLYTQNGSYQLYVEELRQEGAGELFLKFEMLKQRLNAEGLFDPSLKKPLPLMPRTIGVVTSRTGAVLRDIVRVARRRNPRVNILLAASSVQGTGAAAEIADALDRLNRDGRADVILCGRGGGSMEDLWAFNEEAVARAIARSEIPVISCVGHETDFTIADFVADMRAPTPSAAAELAVPMVREWEADVDTTLLRMTRALMMKQEMSRSELSRLTDLDVLSEPRKFLLEARTQEVGILTQRLKAAGRQFAPEVRRQSVDALELRLNQAMQGRIERERAQVDGLERTLKGLNPSAVLERGYALIYMNGQPVSDVNSVPEQMPFDVYMRDGRFRAVRLSEEE